MKINISANALIFGSVLFLVVSCMKEDIPPGPVTDSEGNTYKTVKIGNQIWMSENLKTTSFSNGTEIPLTQDSTVWATLTTPSYCWYNNDKATYKESFGALYNGYTINSGNICPTGWHIPTVEDWQLLREFLTDTLKGGGKLKEAGTAHWLTPNKGADNSTGFTAVAAGIRYFEGTFKSVLYYTAIWSGSDTDYGDEWFLSLYYGDEIARMNHRSKKHGFSVRCIKD